MNQRLTIKQASELTGYSQGHLRRLCIQGAFGNDGAEKFANAWAIDKDKLKQFVREAKSRGGAAGPK